MFRPLVAAQIAFSFVVLFVGGMCLTSFAKLLRTDLGFDASDLALANITVSATGTGPSGRLQPRGPPLLERLEKTPGITSASLSHVGAVRGPWSFGRNKSVQVPGRPVDAYTPWFLLEKSFFALRTMTDSSSWPDETWSGGMRNRDRRLAVIVNEDFAKQY